jgi:tetratricopeptide (TPR) repeat protein
MWDDEAHPHWSHPMLDVHPPHQATHTWKDFFIHIATIVIGLLIAVGLEQTVEWLHHRSEVRETRQLLAEERTRNINLFHENVTRDRLAVACLKNDLRIFQFLQQHPGTSREKLPGIPVWFFTDNPYAQASWIAAGQANILTLMPEAEVEDSRNVYSRLMASSEKQLALIDAFKKASAYESIQPDPSKLTRAQVDAEISLIQDCLRIVSIDMQMLSELAEVHADFFPGPSDVELQAEHWRDIPKGLAAAWAFTQHDFENLKGLRKADQPALEFARQISERGAGHLPEVYKEIHAKYPDFEPDQNSVNGFGYIAMYKGDLPGAINVFKFNVQRHPNSWDVYDSLGEAYAKAGKKKFAIENYQHAHQLNPANSSPIEALDKLQK